MRRPRLISWVVLVVLILAVLPARTLADGLPQLVFREIKITGDEFVVLQNIGSADIDHLSDYWLGYASSNTATAPPVQQLPDFALPAGDVILLSGGGSVDTCDASIVSDLTPSLSDSAGSLNLWLASSGTFTQLSGPQAEAVWGKSTSTSSLPAGELDLKNQTSQYAVPVWFYASVGWSLADLQGCSLITYVSSADTTGTQAISWPTNDSEPPAQILSLATDEGGFGGMAAGDEGLRAPQITELLPNPASPTTDADGEFIELYNPNSNSFDLDNFVLETGLSTRHKYTFPANVMLKAGSFTAFKLKGTGLSLSNSGGQAELFDPMGNLISKTDEYSAAKDGQAWALANGKWYWTIKPTPSAANVINQTGSGSGGSGANGPQILGSSTSGSPGTGSGSTINSTSASAAAAPIHAWTLAGVGGAALLYAGYEYKAELASNLYRARRYLAARRAAGK